MLIAALRRVLGLPSRLPASPSSIERRWMEGAGLDPDLAFATTAGIPASFWARASYRIPMNTLATEPEWHFEATFRLALRGAPTLAALHKLRADNEHGLAEWGDFEYGDQGIALEADFAARWAWLERIVGR